MPRGRGRTGAIALAIFLRTAEVENPLGLALGFLEAYPAYEAGADPWTFDERDLRRANRGGARISAAEIASILERRAAIEHALGEIAPNASLTSRSIPWGPLARLFDGFGDIRGVGFSKMTKALHPKRPALIPILDSLVQAYLAPDALAEGAFGERAAALVRAYKRDLDRNRPALREIRRELVRRGHVLSEVRILDIVIWSVLAP